MHKEALSRKCLILTEAQGGGSGPLAPQDRCTLPFPAPLPNQGGRAPLRGCSVLPLFLPYQVPADIWAPPQGAAGAPGFCRRKDRRTRVWFWSRRLREAEPGALPGTPALGSPAALIRQHLGRQGRPQSLQFGSFSVVHLRSLSADPSPLPVTQGKKEQCARLGWSLCQLGQALSGN